MRDKLRSVLEGFGLGEFHDVLLANDVDAGMLSDLTDQDLRELGLSLGQRNRFLKAVRAAGNGARGNARPAAERRQLTTLFCDLVASTRLATQIDPEDLRDVIQSYQRFCTAILHAHGGHLAYSQGDGLMAYFGFPQAGEDDPLRALRAGLEIAERIGQLPTAAPDPLQIRIGIATGIVVIGDSEDGAVAGAIVVGETPNLAARLQQAAHAGEVVIAEATRRLCGAMFDYESRGAVEFKGFDDPVPVYRVIRESTAPNRFEAHADGGLSPIVGRDDELALLRRLWRSTLAGEGGSAIISGEAGIGKSRLTRAFIEHVRRDQHRIVQWHCAGHLANRPLHPVAREVQVAIGSGRGLTPEQKRDALQHYVAAAPGLDSADVPWLADLLGLANEDRPDFDAPTRARLLTDVLLRRIMAPDVPTIVILEDAHWADAATIDLVTALLPRLANRPVLVLVTHRPNFDPPWSGDDHMARIALRGIDAAAGEALLRVVAKNRTLPANVARIILEKAGGVPLFVEELTKTVLDSASDEVLLAQGIDAVLLPATLHDSLMARLDRLGDAKEIAQLGSVIGREFSADMLRVIAPDYRDIEDNLRRLCDSGLAFERGGEVTNSIVFHHALIQDAAYEALLKKRRREVHSAIAQAMISGHGAFAGAEPETIARHCSRGGLDEQAAEHWLRAGLHAMDRAANGAAVVYLRNALDQNAKLPHGETKARRELTMHQALAGASMPIFGWASEAVENACAAARDLAIELNDGESLYGARWGFWSTQFLRGRQDSSLAVALDIDAMAEAVGAPLMLTLADHAVGFSRMWRGEYEDAVARADRAIARYNPELERGIMRTLQLSSTLTCRVFRATALWSLGRFSEAAEGRDGAMEFAESLDHRPTMAFALGGTGQNLTMQREWNRLHATATRLLRLSQDEGYVMWATDAEMQLALVRGFRGDPEGALVAFEDARERFLSTRTLITDAMQQAAAAELMLRVGQHQRAIDRLTETITDADQRCERNYLSELYRIRALARHVQGDRDGAMRDLVSGKTLALSQKAAPLIRFIDRTAAELRLEDSIASLTT